MTCSCRFFTGDPFKGIVFLSYIEILKAFFAFPVTLANFNGYVAYRVEKSFEEIYYLAGYTCLSEFIFCCLSLIKTTGSLILFHVKGERFLG